MNSSLSPEHNVLSSLSHIRADLVRTASRHASDSDDSLWDYMEDTQHIQPQPSRLSHLQYPFFHLEVTLLEGRDLLIKDMCGTSDPYVKIKIGGKTVYKSHTIYKNLNPKWDERVVLPIIDVLKPLQFRVFDYDRGLHDDPMGNAEVDLTAILLNVPTDLKLLLTEPKSKQEYMGYLLVSLTLIPKSQDDKEVQLGRKSVTISDQAKKLKMQIWSGVVTIVLVEGRDLLPMDDNGLSDPYVKFRLGNEKYRSKHKSKTLNPRWLEQFDLRLYDENDQQLEIAVYDKDSAARDDFMGRIVIDLTDLEKEVTHTLDKALEDGAGYVKILLTLTGSQGNETISDLTSYTPNPQERDNTIRRYGVLNSFTNLRDIGCLQVKVFKAQGLPAADFVGKSDPFCVLELVNARLQTQTEYKTLNPEWNKVFTFNVKDIHSVLEVTVYDEDRDKSVEFLGKVAIPLLHMKNGQRKWYTLKDKKLQQRKKGSVQLEFDFIFNPIKAAIRTIKPREEKYMQPEQKFKIPLMKRNIERVHRIVSSVMDGGRFIQSCFEWESTSRSVTAFIVFMVIVWCFEIYMLPCTLLLLFLKNFLIFRITAPFKSDAITEEIEEDDEDDEDEERDREERKSIREKLHTIQEVLLQVQNAMDAIASFGERIKNTFNWAVPWLSALGVFIFTLAAIVLYNIPLRYVIMAWGINKFTKKLRAPNAIPNNELLDYLSRTPSDNELIMYEEFKSDQPSTGIRKKKKVPTATLR